MWTISLPLRVAVSKNKDFSLNLNQYRNAHFQTLNKAKVEFTELASKLVREAGIPALAQVSLEYVLYPGTLQRCDVNNICSIVDKFFSDTLVKTGILKDDNYLFLADSRFRFGSIDRENPRVDVIIRTPEVLKESEQTNMKISTVVTLTQLDMSNALREFIAKSGTVVPEGELQLTLDSGSGYQIRFDKTDETPAETKHRKSKMDPKTAMEKLQEKLTTLCPDCGMVLTSENSSKSAKDGRLLHVNCPKAAVAAGAIKTSELANKEPPPVAQAELPFDATKTEAAPIVPEASVAPVATQALTPEVTPPPPAKSSLFANFKRPSNEPATK